MKIIKENNITEGAQYSKSLLKLIDRATDQADLNESDDLIYVEEICTTFGMYAATMMLNMKDNIDKPDVLSKLTENNAVAFFKKGFSLV